MLGVGEVGQKVRSAKLLRRLETKGLIEEPPLSERPTLPSASKWGGKRGYCHVASRAAAVTFDFEGSRYHCVDEDNRTYIYKINAHLQKH